MIGIVTSAAEAGAECIAPASIDAAAKATKARRVRRLVTNFIRFLPKVAW
jgi:hypothetical protein